MSPVLEPPGGRGVDRSAKETRQKVGQEKISKKRGRGPGSPCYVKICLKLPRRLLFLLLYSLVCFLFWQNFYYKELSFFFFLFPFHSKDINSAKDVVQKVCTRLDKLQGSQQNSLAAFGSSTVSIRKVIDQYYAWGSFRKKPLRPMGMILIMLQCIHLECLWDKMMQKYLSVPFSISKRFQEFCEFSSEISTSLIE